MSLRYDRDDYRHIVGKTIQEIRLSEPEWTDEGLEGDEREGEYGRTAVTLIFTDGTFLHLMSCSCCDGITCRQLRDGETMDDLLEWTPVIIQADAS